MVRESNERFRIEKTHSDPRRRFWGRLLEEKVRGLGEGALVVMGSHGRRGIGRLLWGSKAEEIVRDCPCPVLVVKAPSPMLAAVGPGATATASDSGA